MRNHAVTYLATLLVALGLGACGKGSDQPATNADGEAIKVYRHSMDGAPTNLDPLHSATVYANFLVLNTYDTLYSYKYLTRPYALKPNLAAAMPEISDDGLSYTIRIKPGVRFVDDPAFENGQGRELVAADVAYSLKRHFDPSNRSQGSWLWAGRIKGLDQWGQDGADYNEDVEGLEVVDDHTLAIHLTKPYPQLTYTLAMGFAGVVPHEAVDKYGRELSIRPVGSGPFRMAKFDTAKAVLEANPHFRQEPIDLAAEGFDPAIHGGLGLEAIEGRSPPFIDRLEIDFILETAARWNSFTKGNEIQFTSVPVEQTDTVLDSRDPIKLKADWTERYHSTTGVEAGFVFTSLNMDKPYLGHNDDPQQDARNRELRCAMRDAMDWSARNNRFYSGIGVVFPGIVPPAASDLHSKLPQDSISRNLERARTRLEKAGWTQDNLPTLEYGFQNSVTSRQLFEQFRGFMADIGYPSSKIKPVSFATFGDYNKAIKTSQLDVIPMGWGLDYPDSENTLQLFYGPNHTPGSNNSNYNNPAFDALFEKTAVMQPGPEREKLYLDMSQMVLDDCVTISGLSRNRIYLWHKDVIGLPNREILGGFWLRYVDIKNADEQTAPAS